MSRRKTPTIRIFIEVENAAFEEGGGAEVASILRGLADQYAQSGRLDLMAQLRDSNGNRVGEAVLIGGG